MEVGHVFVGKFWSRELSTSWIAIAPDVLRVWRIFIEG
jgi:hypothetical protein